MGFYKFIAPAKVNLVLAVGNKRSDGFHEVDTIMHALALHDILNIRHMLLDRSGQGLVINLSCEVADGIQELELPAEENIVYQAIKRLAKKLNRTEDEQFDVVLTKRIPHEAGLGGGSSDAAAALKAAALAWGLPENDARIQEVARELGSDVAFFLQGGCAYLTGRGDEFHHDLIPRKDLVLLVRPAKGVSTKEAYQAFDKKPVEVPHELKEQLKSVHDAAELIPWNNLEDVADMLVPELAEIKELAQESGVNQVLLCGSGSVLCLFCGSFEKARAFSVCAQRKGYWTRISAFASVGAQQINTMW